MKCSLGVSNFLEEISSLSHSIVFLYIFALITEEMVIKTIPKKKKCQKAKWLSEEALQIAEKAKRERYTHLNAEFQKIAKRDKKAFLSDQCKEIEENNRMGKTRDL